MILRSQNIDVDVSVHSFKCLTLLWPWSWPFDLQQNLFSSSVPSTAPKTKDWWNSVHWFVSYRTNRTHARMLGRTKAVVVAYSSTHGRTAWKHNAACDAPVSCSFLSEILTVLLRKQIAVVVLIYKSVVCSSERSAIFVDCALIEALARKKYAGVNRDVEVCIEIHSQEIFCH